MSCSLYLRKGGLNQALSHKFFPVCLCLKSGDFWLFCEAKRLQWFSWRESERNLKVDYTLQCLTSQKAEGSLRNSSHKSLASLESRRSAMGRRRRRRRNRQSPSIPLVFWKHRKQPKYKVGRIWILSGNVHYSSIRLSWSMVTFNMWWKKQKNCVLIHWFSLV